MLVGTRGGVRRGALCPAVVCCMLGRCWLRRSIDVLHLDYLWREELYVITALPRAASRAYRPPRCALCQAPQSSATRPKGGSPCQKRRLVGPQTTVGRTPIKPAKPSLARFSTAARPNTRCKRSASVICGRHARGELFDCQPAQVQRPSCSAELGSEAKALMSAMRARGSRFARRIG